ncbi:hypothetical protein HDV02_004220 [Globomyces sp. JEL0801]|nr:hypothetical protein HDV02_004220 [Globomyces sp. JEL0801]
MINHAKDSFASSNVVLKYVIDTNIALNEIQSLLHLNHIPHIAKLLNYYDQNNAKVLVFPKYSPISLKNVDLAKVALYTTQLITILAQIHDAGYSHLDVTPSNIMLDDHMHLTLIDFGLARKFDDDIPAGCGTPGYIAPETYVGKESYGAADIYSAGIIIGQLLEIYLPGISLNYLGSKLVRHTTTTFICKKIDSIKQDGCDWAPIMFLAADLLSKMLQEEPANRLSAKEILDHPFLKADPSQFIGFDFDTYSKKIISQPLIPRRSNNPAPKVYYRGRS